MPRRSTARTAHSITLPQLASTKRPISVCIGRNGLAQTSLKLWSVMTHLVLARTRFMPGASRNVDPCTRTRQARLDNWSNPQFWVKNATPSINPTSSTAARQSLLSWHVDSCHSGSSCADGSDGPSRMGAAAQPAEQPRKQPSSELGLELCHDMWERRLPYTSSAQSTMNQVIRLPILSHLHQR